MGWHSSVIVRISRSCERKVSLQPAAMICSQSLCYNHRPIKRQPQLVSMSTRTPQNTCMRAGRQRAPEKETRRLRHVWTRSGQGIHLLALPVWPNSATAEEFALGEGELKLGLLFWATTLLCYKSGIAYNRHFSWRACALLSERTALGFQP